MIRELWLRIKRFILPYPLAFIGKYSVKLLLWSCKVKVLGLTEFKASAEKGGCMMMLWHSRMALTCEFFKKYAPEIHYAAFLSKSRDGEPIARILKSYPKSSSIRVAHNRKHDALRELILRLKNGKEVVLITPDGPKGPREKVKEGIILAAKATQSKVIPFTWEADRYWQLGTWDGFRMPKPFSTITISLGDGVLIAPEMESAAAAELLERSLANLETSTK